VGYIVDAVATDLKYGGNERSSKAGEYYYLYPSLATVSGYANPEAQLDQTTLLELDTQLVYLKNYYKTNCW
jgi:hypothetical protein